MAARGTQAKVPAKVSAAAEDFAAPIEISSQLVTDIATRTQKDRSEEIAKARQVELILSRVDALPTLSPVATRVMQLGASDNVDIEQLATLIESDPALTARILGLCRRADKGLGDRVVSVKRAVVMLGLEAVRSAVLSVSVYDALKPLDDHRRRELDSDTEADDNFPTVFDRTGFWKYSVGVASAAELLASRLPRSNKKSNLLPEEAFLCGLLHAIGRIALQWLLPNAYERAVRLALARSVPLAMLERQLFGLDYHTAGRRLAQRWQLPASVQDSIWLHDSGATADAAITTSEHSDMVMLVTAARALVRSCMLGFSGDGHAHSEAARVLREFGIDGDAEAITHELHENVAERSQLLGLDDANTSELLMESLTQATTRLHAMHEQSRQRAAVANTQQKVIQCVCAFHDDTGRALTREDTVEALARSATSLLGHGFYALLLPGERSSTANSRATTQSTASRSTLFQFQSGRIANVRQIDPPGTLRDQFSVAALSQEGAMNISSLGLLPWLGDELVDAPDLRTLKLLPIPGEPNTSFEGAALLTDRSLTGEQDVSGYSTPSAPLDRTMIKPLVCSWSTALRNAADRELAQQLHEQLVEASRALTQAQKQIAEHEAMARLGETTAGAAHEMNNPLAVISGRAQVLLTRTRDAKDRAALQAIAEASTQVSGLVESLHLLSKKHTPQDRACDLPEAISKIVEKAREQASINADVSLELSRLPRLVAIDAELLKGALHEVIVNALEANPRGPVLIQGLVDPSSRTLVFKVTDSGPGLSEKARIHAFDPFFSERTAGRGRGLGLARAKLMAESLDGSLTLTSPNPQTPSRGGTVATLTIKRWSVVA
ncbi:MAG: HDOD domain-containing protein [Phycisphaerales bacterium]